MRGECPVAGAGAPGSGAPRTLFLTAFTIDFLRFEGHFSCPVWVLRRDSFGGRVWYGSRTNLLYPHIILPGGSYYRPGSQRRRARGVLPCDNRIVYVRC